MAAINIDTRMHIEGGEAVFTARAFTDGPGVNLSSRTFKRASRAAAERAAVADLERLLLGG